MKPTSRTFELAAGGDAHRVAFGADPRVEITADAPFTTEDESLADTLAEHPQLVETTSKPRARKAAAEAGEAS